MSNHASRSRTNSAFAWPATDVVVLHRLASTLNIVEREIIPLPLSLVLNPEGSSEDDAVALEAPRVGKGGKGHPPHLGEDWCCFCLLLSFLLVAFPRTIRDLSAQAGRELTSRQPASGNAADGSKELPKGPHPRLVAARCQGIQSCRLSRFHMHAYFAALANTCFAGS